MPLRRQIYYKGQRQRHVLGIYGPQVLEFADGKSYQNQNIGGKVKQLSRQGVRVWFKKIYIFFKFFITEEQLSANRKHVCFFAYNLRMERGTVLILTWLSAQCQYL